MALGHLYFLLKPYIFKVECPESVSFSSKRPAEERRKLAERLKKNYEAQFIEALQLDGCWGTMSCLYDYCRSYVRERLLT